MSSIMSKVNVFFLMPFGLAFPSNTSCSNVFSSSFHSNLTVLLLVYLNLKPIYYSKKLVFSETMIHL